MPLIEGQAPVLEVALVRGKRQSPLPRRQIDDVGDGESLENLEVEGDRVRVVEGGLHLVVGPRPAAEVYDFLPD